MAVLTPSAFSRRQLLALAGAAALAACDSKPGGHTFHGVDITGADYAQALSLTDPDGKVRTLADWKGKLVVVFFGYTQCPDVCPTTMAELAQVRQALGPDGDKLQGVFVTVDPERDSAALLKDYVNNFGAGFVGLRGTPEQTLATAKAFKVFFSKVPGKTDTSYTMDHTAGSYVFDTQGRIRLFERHGTGVKFLTEDFKALLAGA
ncbi:uncharacterized protein SCO1/SenC/PrrC [Burkholderiales bacterium JOSHI_001]|nr:uncharacterized protein SCO1/SenC/PrrC [Burkholderiales bacterium JOSHI_001]